MKLLKGVALFVLSGLFFYSCVGKSGSVSWDHFSVFAERKGDLITLDPALLKDTVVIPLSELIEEVYVVKLDDREEALIDESMATISEKHILVKSWMGGVSKLFDIHGTYLTDVGKVGQGPGEYQIIYSHQLDEINQRIYLLPWQSNQILVFDLDGNALEPIRLPGRIPKGIFKVQNDQVLVGILPFEGMPNVAWVQSVEGEVLYEVPAGTLTVPRSGGINCEIESKGNTENIELSFWYYPPRIDTLYHLDFRGQLLPRFTAGFGEEMLAPHSYVEWPDYFLGNTSTVVNISVQSSEGMNRSTEGKEPAYYIVDKKSLKAAFLVIQNDLLGVKEEWPLGLFNDGYYVINDDPGNIEEMLQKALQSDLLNEKYRKRWMELLDQIDPNDNNYIIYAKMKR